ncbi:MAG: hypothetical protein KAV82_10325 [Phycisphaerae bacterium]|nr:hypothetical protein [Phycisphaerae bacterium]
MKRIVVVLSVILLAGWCLAAFPVVDQGDVQPNDNRLKGPIDESKQGELTLASFNIRNLAARKRCLKDFEVLADLVDEADVVMIQEAGMGIYDNDPNVSKAEAKRMKAVVALLQINLGDGWTVLLAPTPSGSGLGAETVILAHRKSGKGYTMSAAWDGYADLGDKRDMGVFKLTLTKDDQTKEMLLGSVHLTPEDPDRGQQMIKVADWLVARKQQLAVVMGDFNWGYKKTAGVQNYLGEEKVKQHHADGDLFQIFHSLSYLGKATEGKLRTNMGFRKGGYFYDQFLTTPPLASKMADSGKLLKDCGMIAFGTKHAHMKKAVKHSEKKRGYGLKQFLKHAGLQPDAEAEGNGPYVKATEDISKQAHGDATLVLSDHRVIWMQLKMW